MTKPSQPAPARPPAPSASSAQRAQRTLVYALTGLLVLTGLLLAMALKDPCEGGSLQMIARCKPTLGQRIPSGSAFSAALVIQLAMIALYELRWYVRTWGVATAGAILIGVGGYALFDGMSTVLVVCCWLIGGALIAAAFGIAREHRGAWAFAVSVTGTLAVVTFFSAAKIGGVLDWSLSQALLPSLGLLLPLTVALGTTSPSARATATTAA